MRLFRMTALGTSLVTAALLGTLFAGSLSAQSAMTIQLSPQNNSGQRGTATLTPMGNQTMVTVVTTGAPAGPQPIHIHTGTCANLGGVEYPLTNMVNGRSETMVDASLTHLTTAEQHSVNIHKSPQEASVYTACGEIPMAGGSKAGAAKGAPAQAAPAPAAPAKGAPAQAAPAQAPGKAGVAPAQAPGKAAAAPAQAPGKAAAAPAQAPGKAAAAAPAQAPKAAAAPAALPRTGGDVLPLAGLAATGLFSLGFGVFSRRRAG